MSRNDEIPGHDTKPVVRQLSDGESVTEPSVSAIAEARGPEAQPLTSMREEIETSALDDPFRNSAGLEALGFRMTFEANGCKVVIYGDGRVVAPSAESPCTV